MYIIRVFNDKLNKSYSRYVGYVRKWGGGRHILLTTNPDRAKIYGDFRTATVQAIRLSELKVNPKSETNYLPTRWGEETCYTLLEGYFSDQNLIRTEVIKLSLNEN